VGDAKFPQHGTFLRVMGLHPLEDVIKGSDGGDVRPFVQHDALRPMTHGRVGDLRTRGDPLLGERCLRGPC
jgi:hypothetical protein